LVGGHEVEERSVMPDHIAPRWSPGPDIANQPLHTLRGGTKALLGGPHANDRHVKHRDVGMSTR
jgi:hypothetical protein